MYTKILVALENGSADGSLLPHVRELARVHGAELLVVHVADGWAARCYDQLNLAESEEIKADRAYLEMVAGDLRNAGLKATVHLAMGDPAQEILKSAARERCDLIAMTTHGHRFFGDLIFGSTIHEVRHSTFIPVLLVRAAKA